MSNPQNVLDRDLAMLRMRGEGSTWKHIERVLFAASTDEMIDASGRVAWGRYRTLSGRPDFDEILDLAIPHT